MIGLTGGAILVLAMVLPDGSEEWNVIDSFASPAACQMALSKQPLPTVTYFYAVASDGHLYGGMDFRFSCELETTDDVPHD